MRNRYEIRSDISPEYLNCFKLLIKHNIPTEPFFVDMMWGLKVNDVSDEKAIELINNYRTEEMSN